jgi:hypothetical protein
MMEEKQASEMNHGIIGKSVLKITLRSRPKNLDL